MQQACLFDPPENTAEPFDDHVPLPDLDDAIIMACPVRWQGVWLPAHAKLMPWSMPLERQLLNALTDTPATTYTLAKAIGLGDGINLQVEHMRRQVEKMALLDLVEIVSLPQSFRPPMTAFKKGKATP
ncbi:hypothetical protein SAMN05660443_0204 [Marinospirillum celere]|uniref:Uncharacterized protein n=1 Tax=Marinospirillum celere TaxID=1122252 RepID=A0A1I1E4Y9_9GAMM|nr:hypothetical protein [Marinospirillum celere]SFB79990.1 hypothetical protein SAMN05660443_0204 [Marinospirillum celere]